MWARYESGAPAVHNFGQGGKEMREEGDEVR